MIFFTEKWHKNLQNISIIKRKKPQVVDEKNNLWLVLL